jgi:hypothetical protein
VEVSSPQLRSTWGLEEFPTSAVLQAGPLPSTRLAQAQEVPGHFFAASNGLYPNFCLPTLASYTSPPLVAVKIATSFSYLAVAVAPAERPSPMAARPRRSCPSFSLGALGTGCTVDRGKDAPTLVLQHAAHGNPVPSRRAQVKDFA